uniref:Retrotransposon gag domain-containing protein n=1 Tax=Tanacetum cinerariifolium TaxID=118510 RepID=A0A6L2NM07_TANCI|nr:hypothetical protein [Tanacetum cinerariifolium]
MTRSSTKELITPFENPKRVFHSKRRLFETHGLVKSSSPKFDFYSDIEEHSEEEETIEIMTETMEQYLIKTRGNYGSGVARPKINEKTHFELKGQFLKELRENTFSGSELEGANEHIKKFLEIVDLFHIPEVTQDQIMLLAFPISLTEAASRWLRNEPSGLITNWETLKIKFLNKYCPPARTAKKMEEINNFQQELDEILFRAWERFKELLMKCPHHYLTDMQEVILFYNGLDVPTREILDLKGAIPTKTATDAKSYEKEESKVKRGSIEPNPKDHVKLISTAKANSSVIRRIGSGPHAVLNTQYNNLTSEIISFPNRLHGYCCGDWKEARKVKIIKTYDPTLPQKEKDPRSFTLHCFIYDVCFDKAIVDLGESVSVMPFSTYYNLGLGDLAYTRLTIELADRTIKHPRGIAENVLVRIGKFIFSIEFVILDIPEDDDDKGDHEWKNLAGTLIDIPIFVGKFSIISDFSITDDMDITSGVVLGMPFCKKFVLCQKIMERFAYGDKCERMDDE